MHNKPFYKTEVDPLLAESEGHVLCKEPSECKQQTQDNQTSKSIYKNTKKRSELEAPVHRIYAAKLVAFAFWRGRHP